MTEISHWLDLPHPRQDVVSVPILWLTIVLSLLIHLVALFLWIPTTPLFGPKAQEEDLASERLQVQLATQATPAPAPEAAREAQAPPPPTAPPRRPARIRPPPIVAPPNQQAPAIAPPAPPVASPPPPTPPVAASPRPSPPAENDLLAYVEARRRARGEQAAPEDEKAKFNRSLAANLPAAAHGVASQDTKKGGGIFAIKRMAFDDAAFEFYGWNRDMGRRTPQLIEVRKGDNGDMRIAVVRRMIAIIRQFEKEDFVWESTRRNRTFTLSARLSDNEALETFLIHEFFDDAGNSH